MLITCPCRCVISCCARSLGTPWLIQYVVKRRLGARSIAARNPQLVRAITVMRAENQYTERLQAYVSPSQE